MSWSGLVDAYCGAAIAPPSWTFHVPIPSCAPGTNGIVGTTVTRLATNLGLGSIYEYSVAADDQPGGYVYFGGYTDLHRTPKAGGTVEDVASAAGVSYQQLGYSMAIAGSQVFTLADTTSTSLPFLWQLTANGGMTWNALGYGLWPITPAGTPYAMTYYDGKLYIVTKEFSASDTTQIWSVDTTSMVLPQTPVLEGSFTGENYCDGIAADDHYFYLTCYFFFDRLVRVDRTSFQPELVTDAIPLDPTKNDLIAHDVNGDGTADALYVKTSDQTVRYVCSPAGAPPFWADVLASFGSTTSGSSGLGFDPVANTLWALDHDTNQLISIPLARGLIGPCRPPRWNPVAATRRGRSPSRGRAGRGPWPCSSCCLGVRAARGAAPPMTATPTTATPIATSACLA